MKTSVLVFLSGERTSIPRAEARSLFLLQDPETTFEFPEPRVLIAQTTADPALVESRVAFSRRVGRLISEPPEVSELVRGRTVRVRGFSTKAGTPDADPAALLRGLDVRVDLEDPEFELTVVQGEDRYLALTCPSRMRQGWSHRRPRRRPFFHPSAIFPKLSRALVNLSRCKEGKTFLDPFSGTGSLPMEAAEIGARAIGCDLSEAMVRGSLKNMKEFRQSWLGIVRCDSALSPIKTVDAIATDVPYGRASSTMGQGAGRVIRDALSSMGGVLDRGSRMVLMHPEALDFEPGSEWTVEENHSLYVHKLLTRTITVLRRR